MHVYDIYEHPRFGLETVRVGFSWSAFFMPSVWAVQRRLGFTTLLLVFATSLVFDVARLLGDLLAHPAPSIAGAVVLFVLVGIRPALKGYHWHADALLAEGYQRRETIAAPNRCAALRAYATRSYLPVPIQLAN